MSPLIRFGGIAAVISGALLVGQEVVLAIAGEPESEGASMAHMLVYALAHIPLVTMALIAWHTRQAEAAGRFGVLALLVAVTGQLLFAGVMFMDVVVGPALRDVAPAFVDEPPAAVAVGYIASLGVYVLGWVVFGIATLRAGVLPRAAAGLMAVGGVAGFVLTEATSLPGALVPLYASWIWLGVATARGTAKADAPGVAALQAA